MGSSRQRNDYDTEATKLVLAERHDGVLTITISRPAQENALNHAVAERLGAALDLLDADPELLAGVLTGAGATFSAGMDLKAFARPLIAAVEGWARRVRAGARLRPDRRRGGRAVRFARGDLGDRGA